MVNIFGEHPDLRVDSKYLRRSDPPTHPIVRTEAQTARSRTSMERGGQRRQRPEVISTPPTGRGAAEGNPSTPDD